MKPFFSIIIPLFNSEQYIRDTVKSVIKQTFSNWELIIIEDGSWDNSYEVANEFARHNNRIRILQHVAGANKGVSSSRNLGIKNAIGEWIAFLDADDIWHCDKLQRQHEIIKRESPELVFVYSLALIINEKSDQITSVSLPVYKKKSNLYGAGNPGIYIRPLRSVINSGFEAPTSSVVIRKRIIDDSEIRFREHLRYTEDTLFWYEVIKHGNIYFITEPLISYRVHSDQWTTANNRQLKIGRRFLIYSEMLTSAFSEYKNLISFLLINKGLRLIFIYYLTPANFDCLNILKYLKKTWLLPIPVFYKILSIPVFFMEFFLMPVRFIKNMLKSL